MANWASQPGPTRVSGQAMIPALSITMSRGGPEARNRSAKRAHAVEVAEVELVDLDRRDPAQRLPRGAPGRRAGTTTRAPAPASARVVSSPRPE